MTRFTVTDKREVAVITDIANTEPICTIIKSDHPYAVEMILEALNRRFAITGTGKSSAGG